MLLFIYIYIYILLGVVEGVGKENNKVEMGKTVSVQKKNNKHYTLMLYRLYNAWKTCKNKGGGEIEKSLWFDLHVIRLDKISDDDTCDTDEETIGLQFWIISIK